MVDIASLGLEVRSDGVVVANKRLRETEKQAKRTETAAERLTRQAEKMGASMNRIGRTMSLSVTAPLVAAAAASVKFATDFESSFANVEKTVDATEEQFAQMSNEIRQLSREVPTSVNELNRLAGVAGQLGVARENIVEFTKTIAMLGDATDIAGEQAALSISRFMNVMGTAQSDVDRVGSTIVGLGNDFAALESEIVKTATSMAAMGNEMGLTEAQVLAFATAIAASGGQTEAASTAFQKTASNMKRAVLEVNEDLAVFARTAGVSAEQFSTAFREDASNALLMFLQGLRQVSDEGESTAAVLDELGLADQRLQREFGKLLGNLDQLEEAIGLAGDEWERNTALTEEAQKRYETFESQLGIFWNRIKDVAITFGNDLIPALKSGIESAEGFLDTLREMDPATRKMVIGVSAVVAAIGPLLIILGTFVGALAKLRPLVMFLAGPAGFPLLAKGVMALMGPLGIIVGSFAALIAHFVSHRREVERLRVPTDEATNALIRMREATQGDLGDQDIRNFQSALGDLNREIEETQNRMENMIEARIMMSQVGGFASEVGDFSAGRESAELAALQERLDTMREARAVEEARLEIAKQFPTQAERNAAAQSFWNEATERGRDVLEKLGFVLPEVNSSAEELANTGGKVKDAFSADFEQSLNRLAAALQGPVAEAQLNYNESVAEVQKLHKEGEISAEQLARAINLYRDELNAAIEDANGLSEAQATFMSSVEDIEASLAGDTATAMLEYRRSVEEANQRFAEGATTLGQYMRALDAFQGRMNQGVGQGMFPDFGMLDSALDGMKDIREEMEEAADIEWKLDGLENALNPALQMLKQLQDDIKTIDDSLQKDLINNTQAGFLKTQAVANAAFGAIMSGMDESSESYKELAFAQEALNTILGIGAILQTAATAPWPANFVAMAQMAAMVASLGVSAGSLGGGGGNLAEQRQETQGTGSVLGDPEAKSESISNAIEITADATSELVGINRGMLHALQTMQEGIAGAATQVARGAMDFDLSTLSLGTSDWGFTSTTLADQGIALMSGAIQEMTEGAVAQVFATTRESNLFSTDYDTELQAASDELNSQINLVFQSMITTVTEAGEALGIPLADIEARIAAFEVAAQEISLKDLSGEEQQEELEAVFSRIFDDLASAVIPFIDQFQQIGEGMGETLVRVATSVQVAEEAINRLGLNIDENLGPEKMAQVSVGLVEAAGGIENFISDMENFVGKFAPEAHQFAIAQSDITRALEQMNMDLPETREGFWQLIQSIDATTEAGQQQIATLLSLADAADTFYSKVEEIQQEREGLEQRLLELNGQTAELRRLELQELDESNRALQERIWALEDEQELADMMSDVSQSLLQELSPAHASLNQLMTTYNNMLNSARELGASEEQLMRIRQLHSAQLNAMAATLRAGIGDAVEDLFGDGGMSSSMSSTASSVNSSMNDIRDSMIRALEGVKDWLDSSMLSDTSPLMPEQRLGEAQRQFDQAITAALGGDVDAMSDLPGLADQLLSEAGGFFGTSTSEFDKIWMQVREAMSQVADMDVPDARPPTRGQQSAIRSATESTADSAYQQMLQAQNLIGQIDVLSRITGDTPADIAKELDVPMGRLIELMGDSPENTASALGEQFNNLVTDFGESLNPLMGVERNQLIELQTLNTNMATWLGSTAQLEEPNEGSRAFMPKDDPVLTGSSGSSDKGSEETNERLGRLEEALESIARSTSQTANASERSASGVNDLVINERVRNSRNQATRLR